MGDEDESDDDFTTFAQQPRDHVTLDQEIREHLPVVKMPRRESTGPDYHKRCAVDGCDTPAAGRGPEKEFCQFHGGGKLCEFPGCITPAHKSRPGMFCYAHGGGDRCEHESGCLKHASGGGRMCRQHATMELELVRRIKRNKALREKWLDVILLKQGNRCANPNKHCYEVTDGAATAHCPWGDDLLPRDAAQLDHIQPLCEGGTDDEANLQVVCACCHAIKSIHEARTRDLRCSSLGL